jgi:uncharacterized protein (DUF58 family)
MAQDRQRRLASLVEAAQAIASGAWIAAIIYIPLALLLRSYATALLVVILMVAWQVLAFLIRLLLPSQPEKTRARLRCWPTGWGVVYGSVSLLLCIVAVHWGLNLLYLTAAFLMAGLASALVFSGLSLSRLSVKWGVPPHVFAGEPFSVELVLRNEKKLLGAFGLHVGLNGHGMDLPGGEHFVPRLLPGREHRMLLRHSLPARGLQLLPPATVRTGFPSDVLAASLTAQYAGEVLALPRIGHIRRDVLARCKGGEAKWLQQLSRSDPQGDFRSLREYRHGDDPRRIHWPTSARLHRLFVREFERQEMHGVLLLLDAVAPPCSPQEAVARAARFEKAVSFAATMASLLTERGIFYAFSSYCPDLVAIPYDVGPGHLFTALEALAIASLSPEHNLADLVAALSFPQVTGGGVMLVSGGPLPKEQARAVLGPLAHSCVTVDASEPEFDDIFVA